MAALHYRFLKIFLLVLLSTMLFTACGNFTVGIEIPHNDDGNPTQQAEVITVTPEKSLEPTATETPEPIPTALADPTAGLVYTTSDGLWMIDANGQPELLLNEPYARLSPDGRYVVYERNDDGEGGNDIWLLDLTSGDERNLTNTPNLFETGPEFWPGRPDVVVFGTGEEQGMGNRNLPTIVNLDGSGYMLLDLEDGGSRVLSPDGQMIAYNGYDPLGKIYHWNQSPEIFDPALYGISVDNISFLAWSPDNRYLAAKVIGDLTQDGQQHFGFAIFDLEAKSVRLIHIYNPQGGGMVPDYLSWSPDGQWLAFVTFNEPPGTGRQPNLWIIRPDGTGEKYVSQGLNPLWSPDSIQLAFINTGSDNKQHVWLAESGDWQPVELVLPEGPMVNFLVGWNIP